MAVKVLKLAAFPAALGLASFRVYAMTEKKTDDMISPRELSIYNPESPVAQYVEEQPGRLQTGLGRVRVGLQPYVRTVQNGCTSVKIGVTSLYQSGQDMYEFLRDPPPGFLPRVGVITVSGLAGLILARKGSRVKRIGFPLALTTVGAAMCYPRETVGILKLTGKKVYSASSLVASVIKSKPKEDVVTQLGLEPVTSSSKEVHEPEPTEAITREAISPVAPIAEFATELEDTIENVIEGQPADEVTSVAEVTPLSDDIPQEGNTVSEILPDVDVAPVEDSSIAVIAVAQEEAIPVEEIPNSEKVTVPEVSATASLSDVTLSEVREDLAVVEVAPVPDVTLEPVTPVGEGAPVEDTLVLEVEVVPDVAPEEVPPVSEAPPTDVIEISAAADASPPDLIPKTVATVSQVEAASAPTLTLETSPEVDGTLLNPNVASEEMNQAAAELVLEVASEEVAPAVDTSAVDEVLSSSAPLLAEPALEAAPEQDSETEACHEPTHVAEFAPVFEGSKPAAEVAEVALEALDPAVSELAPIETETTPAVSLPAEEHPTFSLSELKNPEEEDVSLSPPPADIADTAPALEENIALPSALPPTDKETTLCPSTTDKIVSVPPVIDQPTLIAATVQQTTSSTPAAENTPTALAEGQTTPPSFATEDTTSPLSDVGEAKSPPPTEEETTSLAAAEPISALNPDSVKVKPRFVPDPSLVDHGQAHPEDADMYSTRG
uniref:MICOS complex subunit n=1 Tax=Astyanax mexicanus TaxID=7994 RepID=A0A8B9HMI8_ASTMX